MLGQSLNAHCRSGGVNSKFLNAWMSQCFQNVTVGDVFPAVGFDFESNARRTTDESPHQARLEFIQDPNQSGSKQSHADGVGDGSGLMQVLLDVAGRSACHL
jgi:hypothetical protein